MFEVDILQENVITVGAVFIDSDIDELLQIGTEPPNPELEKLLAENMMLPPISEKEHSYTFKAESSDNWEVGDYALAHVCSELKLVRVVRVDSQPQFNPKAHYTLKWLVQKIDLTHFANRLAEEKRLRALINAVEIAEKRKALQKRISDSADDPLVKVLQQPK